MSDQEPPEDPEGSQDPEDSDVLEEPIDPEEKSSVKSDSVSEDEHTEALKGILDEMDGDQTPRLSSEGRVVKEPSFVGADTAVKAELPKTISTKKEGPTKPPEPHPAPSSESAPTPAPPAPPPPTPPTETVQEVVLEEKKDDWSKLIESEQPQGKFFHDLSIFLVQMGRAFENRYELWEETFNIILSILRKMKNNVEDNSEKMTDAIQDLFEKMMLGFKDFQKKQSEVERFSDIDYKSVAKQFKKTLELLNFQIRNFKLQMMVDDLYDIYL